jgi:CRP-like cAMP-binding protein
MSNLMQLTDSQPIRTLAPGEILLTEGGAGGTLYVLLKGELEVERDGVKLATATQPGTLFGEMSVLLGRPATATVRAVRESRVRQIDDAAHLLETEPALASRVAGVLAKRLDATSALLVELSKHPKFKADEPGFLGRIVSALRTTISADDIVERRDLFGSDVPGAF